MSPCGICSYCHCCSCRIFWNRSATSPPDEKEISEIIFKDGTWDIPLKPHRIIAQDTNVPCQVYHRNFTVWRFYRSRYFKIQLHQKSSKITYCTRKLTKINLLWIEFNFCCRSCQTPSRRSLQLEQAKSVCSCCSLITASCPFQRLIDAVNSKCPLFVRGTLILFSEVRFRYSISKNYFIVTAATVCVHPFLVSTET